MNTGASETFVELVKAVPREKKRKPGFAKGNQLGKTSKKANVANNNDDDDDDDEELEGKGG